MLAGGPHGVAHAAQPDAEDGQQDAEEDGLGADQPEPAARDPLARRSDGGRDGRPVGPAGEGAERSAGYGVPASARRNESSKSGESVVW